LRVARNLLLILLAALSLPYLLAPLYRVGHPVSTLMAWRWLTGAPVSRQWIDFSAISPSLPRSVVASEDAKFCSHHGIDWDALRDVIDDAEDGEVTRGGSTITQQVAKNLFLWPGRSVVRKALEFPLALWIAEAAHPGNLSQHCRTRSIRPVRRASRLCLRLRPSGISAYAARSGAAGGDPSQSGQAQRPQSRRRRAPPGRDLYGPGAGFGLAAMLERKSCFLSQIWVILAGNHPSFALAHPL
jgi:hypothetical protein